MSAIDIVLVVIALVAVGVAVACALQLKSLRAELRERGDSSAETLAALEQANSALDTLNVALAETRRTANAIAQQQTTDAAVEQQHYLTIAREFSQAGDRMDDLRRETAQQLGANREGIEHRLDKVRETVDAQLGAIRKDNNVQLDQMRATVDEKLSRTLNDRLSASFKQVSDQLEAVYKGLGDMQSIATGVGDLKRVLGNVKARGILGEVQLGAILADISRPTSIWKTLPPSPAPRSALSLPSSCRWTRAIPCCCRSTPSFRATRTSTCSTRRSRAMRRPWRLRARRSTPWSSARLKTSAKST